jgi:hypothetical protein
MPQAFARIDGLQTSSCVLTATPFETSRTSQLRISETAAAHSRRRSLGGGIAGILPQIQEPPSANSDASAPAVP